MGALDLVILRHDGRAPLPTPRAEWVDRRRGNGSAVIGARGTGGKDREQEAEFRR